LTNYLYKNKRTINKHFLGFKHTVEKSKGKEKYELSTEQQSDGTKRIMGIEHVSLIKM
jgi:hypothetical protein